LSGDPKSYEGFLKRAHAEGWRDPVQVTNLEILAYEAGMITERKRILNLLSDVADGRPMRAIDVSRYFERIKNPNKMI
jgi:hypothetical protein